jgi:thioredoxin reductase (NADPH)
MQAQGTRFLLKCEVTKIEKLNTGKFNVHFINLENKSTHSETFDTVLYATGRGADTQGLNLSSTGVKFTSSGSIITDENDRTNIPHIYSVGDVVDGLPELTPVAIQAGELLSRRLFGNSPLLMNYQLIPTTVFTPFEYGRVGLSEEDAIVKFGQKNIEIFLSEFSTLEIAAAHRLHRNPPNPSEPDFPTNCLSKLICLKGEKNKIIGFHFVGPNAGEITQGFALGLRLGATKEDFDQVVGIHPTDAESFMSLGITKSSGEVWETLGGCGGGKCG